MTSRLLVVEEEPQMRARLTEVLRAASWTIDTAANGPGALALVSNMSYDAIIINVALTGMDGLETLARIKSHFPGLSVVVLGQSRSEELLLRALRAGANDFLQRPFTPEELVSTVQRQLKRPRQASVPDHQGLLVRKTLLQAVQAITLMLDLSGMPGRPLPGLHLLGQLALQLAQSQNLLPNVCQDIQLATWLQALCDLPGESPIIIDREELPGTIQEILNGLESGEPPLESKMVALVLALGQGEDITEVGRFEPELVEQVLRRNRGGASQDKRTLLWRARALDQAQQPIEAARLFEQVLKADATSPDGIESALALARLRQRSDLANQAMQAAQRVGPWINSATCFEAGILLAEIKTNAGEVSLQRSTRLYRELDSRHRHALATIAQERFSASPLSPDLVRTAVESLGYFPERELLHRHLDWLAPWLLAYPGIDKIPEILPLIREWVEEQGERLCQGLRRGLWPEAARLGLAKALTRLGEVAGDKLLKLLLLDGNTLVRCSLAEDKIRIVESPHPRLIINSLGPLEVHLGQRRLNSNSWRTQRARTLFAYLASHPDEFQEQERLLEAILWDDPRPEKLPQVVEALQASLQPKSWLPQVAGIEAIQCQDGKIRLNPQLPRWHDLEQLEQSHRSAQSLQGREAADLYRRIITLARGPFLEDFEQEWVRPIRERIQARVSYALLWLARWSNQAGRPAEAYEHAVRLVELEPELEEAGVLVMDALVALNRIDDSLRFFERYKSQGTVSEALVTAQKRAIAALTY